MVIYIPDELECEVEKWFFEYVEDGPYSEALYDLLRILEDNEVTLWERVFEAEAEQEKLDDENDRLKDDVGELKTGFKTILENIEEGTTLKEIKKLIETSILYGEKE